MCGIALLCGELMKQKIQGLNGSDGRKMGQGNSPHNGHRDPSSTRVYAKVDINGLREVAAFDLGELR